MSDKKEPSVQETVSKSQKESVEKQRKEAEAKAAETEAKAAAEKAKNEELKARVEAAEKELEKQPAVVIEDMIAKRQRSIVEAAKKWRPKDVDEDFEPIGVWKSKKAIRKLGLDRLRPGTKLIYDVVPEPGCSTNGVQFTPGSRQLLPENLWRSIYGRTGERQRNEENFMYPKRKVSLPTVEYSGLEGRGPMARRRRR